MTRWIALKGALVQAMSIDQTQPDILKLDKPEPRSLHLRIRKRIQIASVGRVAAVLLVLVLAGGGAVPAAQARTRGYAMAVSGWGFDLLDWEAHALLEKTAASLTQPARRWGPEIASEQVIEYMSRADRIGQIEYEIERRLSQDGAQPDSQIDALQRELEALRATQAEYRPAVEQVIQRQVSSVLADSGFMTPAGPFPPVQFVFTEPPKKLIVSPRDRIATIYSKMLRPDMRLTDIEKAEGEIDESDRARAYITNIGGLGAFPTMVVDRASLDWVLSTVAHEWTHNFLALYPLGWSYFKSQDMTTLNETVAEIVGNEIGAEAARRYYSSVALLPTVKTEANAPEEASEQFDFRAEMRKTRLEVDRLLAAGQVDEAEAYMERRRREFVEHGHPLRVLNQAYFAFHGSYGTSAASTSPIGPKLQELRNATPSLDAFLNTVKWFNDVDDLDKALDEWTPRADGADGDEP